LLLIEGMKKIAITLAPPIFGELIAQRTGVESSEGLFPLCGGGAALTHDSELAKERHWQVWCDRGGRKRGSRQRASLSHLEACASIASPSFARSTIAHHDAVVIFPVDKHGVANHARLMSLSRPSCRRRSTRPTSTRNDFMTLPRSKSRRYCPLGQYRLGRERLNAQK
jgi:hypothetical protein